MTRLIRVTVGRPHSTYPRLLSQLVKVKETVIIVSVARLVVHKFATFRPFEATLKPLLTLPVLGRGLKPILNTRDVLPLGVVLGGVQSRPFDGVKRAVNGHLDYLSWAVLILR